MADAEATEALAAAGDSGNGAVATKPNQGQADSKPSGTGNWLEGLPEAHRKKAEVAKWAGPQDAIQSYIELEKFAHKPVGDMTPEERAKLYKRLGDRPESPDGYELSTVQLPEALGYTKEAEKGFREMALSLGLTKQQAKMLDEHSRKGVLSAIDAAKRAQAKLLEGYETQMRDPAQWGADYDKNLKAIEEMVQKFGDADVSRFVKGPGRHPSMLRLLNKLREAMLEDTLETGGPVATEEQHVPGQFSKEFFKKMGVGTR